MKLIKQELKVARPYVMPLLLLLAVLVAVILATQPFTIPQPMAPSPPSPAAVAVDPAEMHKPVADFCGSCHKLPLPEHLPRRSWPDEIGNAYRRLEQSGKKEIAVPDQEHVVSYFTSLAPLQMVIPDAPESSPSPITFAQEVIDLPQTTRSAAISFLTAQSSRPDANSSHVELLSCNMGSGEIDRLYYEGGQWLHARLATLRNPDHLVACDFDRDGFEDYLVADLGTLNATDELLGRVTLLRANGQSGDYSAITVKQGLGRVADARAADVDGDGDDDVIVAEFGFEKSGRLLWLETIEVTAKDPTTRLHVIDSRHGSIHAPPLDLDNDGDLDIVALFSQEYESIVAFFNDGKGSFTSRVLFEAETPSFGSSGMDLIDLDSDGDMDVLFTNGDTLDKFQLRPFHGVHWLENKGTLQFEYHHLTNLPGAVKAIACDLDGDHDLDIAAVAWCPPELKNQRRPGRFDTLIWLEQVTTGQFERHSLNQTGDGHMAIAAADFDNDGRQDIVVGEASFDPGQRRWLTFFWNRGPVLPAVSTSTGRRLLNLKKTAYSRSSHTLFTEDRNEQASKQTPDNGNSAARRGY